MASRLDKAVLLAAGRGTRLGHFTDATPKPLLEVAGKPIIGHIVDALARCGIESIVLVVGYLAEQIENWASDRELRSPKVKLTTLRQHQLNGTAGAMLAAEDFVRGETTFIFSWGDILMDTENYPRFVEAARHSSCDLILAVNRVDDPWSGAAVYVSKEMRVTRIVEKPARGNSSTNWNNAGLFATTPMLFDYLRALGPSARGELELPQAIAAMIDEGRDVRAIDLPGFWSDIGTPEDLGDARRHFVPSH